jgi:hypothetical protein
MPRKIYITLTLMIGYLIMSYKNIDAFYLLIALLISIGFYFKISAARYLVLFFAHYAALLVLIFAKVFGSECKVTVAGYNLNPIFSFGLFIIALAFFVYSISGKEVEFYFSRKILPEKWLSYINIHVVILYLAVCFASVTYFQLVEKTHEGRNTSKNQQH